MERQGNLFDSFGQQLAHQQSLFDNAGPELVDLTCEECGEPMERTPSGYLVCQHGHGKLHEAELPENVDVEPCGMWFDNDE